MPTARTTGADLHGGGLPPLTITEENLLCKGRTFDFVHVKGRTPDGTTIDRQMVRHPGAVAIVPVLETGSGGGDLVMIRNLRAASRGWILEFPAGTMEPPEPAEACAARELIEETGYRAAKLTPLLPREGGVGGWFYTTPGLTDERMHVFVATGLTHVGQDLQADERIVVEHVPVAEALRLADSGELLDGKSIVALLLAHRRGLLGGGGGGTALRAVMDETQGSGETPARRAGPPGGV